MLGLRSVSSLILAGSMAACATQTAPINHEAERAQLEAANVAFTAAIAAFALEGVMSWIAEDALFYPPDAEMFSDNDSVRDFFETGMSDPNAAAEFEHLSSAISEDGSMGYTVSLLDYTYTAPDGSITTDHERDLHIWRKDSSGNWKVTLDMWNSGSGEMQ